jgi:hypothetical protein
MVFVGVTLYVGLNSCLAQAPVSPPPSTPSPTPTAIINPDGKMAVWPFEIGT